MGRPGVVKKISGGFRRADNVVEDDRIAKFPDRKAEQKSERERVDLGRGEFFHRGVKAAISAGRLQAQALPARLYEGAAGCVRARTNFHAPAAA